MPRSVTQVIPLCGCVGCRRCCQGTDVLCVSRPTVALFPAPSPRSADATWHCVPCAEDMLQGEHWQPWPGIMCPSCITAGDPTRTHCEFCGLVRTFVGNPAAGEEDDPDDDAGEGDDNGPCDDDEDADADDD